MRNEAIDVTTLSGYIQKTSKVQRRRKVGKLGTGGTKNWVCVRVVPFYLCWLRHLLGNCLLLDCCSSRRPVLRGRVEDTIPLSTGIDAVYLAPPLAVREGRDAGRAMSEHDSINRCRW